MAIGGLSLALGFNRGAKVTSARVVLLGLILAVATSHFARAEGLGQKISVVGDWTVYQDKDSMTDAVSCVATYKGRAQVQATTTSLAFSFRGRGGVSSYKYRIDEAPPSDLVLATDIQKQLDSIIFESDTFASIMAAKRFRLQVLTILSSVADEDISLASLPQAVATMKKHGCSN